MKFCLLVFFFVISGCSASLTQGNPTEYRKYLIHADSEFTPDERRTIDDATRALLSQASLDIHVIYDLDFSKAESLSRTPQLLKMPATAPLTRDLDLRYKGTVYGWTLLIPTTTVYLVYERLYGEDFARHVVMHELLHALGCEHVQDPDAVLFLMTDRLHQATRLTAADLAELDRAGRLSR